MGWRMKLKLPDKVLLTAERDADGNVKFTYAERYNDAEIPKPTAAVAAEILADSGAPVTVWAKDNWVSVQSIGFVDHAIFVKMMHAEFECWTSPVAINRVLDMITERYKNYRSPTKVSAKALERLKAELSDGMKRPDPSPGLLSCEHGREGGYLCPHCAGTNATWEGMPEVVCTQCGGSDPLNGLCIHCAGAGG